MKSMQLIISLEIKDVQDQLKKFSRNCNFCNYYLLALDFQCKLKRQETIETKFAISWEISRIRKSISQLAKFFMIKKSNYRNIVLICSYFLQYLRKRGYINFVSSIYFIVLLSNRLTRRYRCAACRLRIKFIFF